MTQDEKRTKIAEACGWKHNGLGPKDTLHHPTNCQCFSGPSCRLPDYFNDLNACHEMEEFISSSLRLRYTLNLTDITDDFFWSKARATAQQRAEAFGKTLNLW